MRRYTLAGFATLGTRQSRTVEVAGESATVDATRSFAAAPRTVAVEDPLEVLLDAQAYLVAAPSYLVPGARRFGLSRFSCPGTRQTRHGVIEGEEGTVAATRDPLVAAARHGAIEGAKGAVAATRVLVTATRHVAVEGVGGTIAATRVLVTATRHGVIEGAEGTLAATRDPLVAVARHAEIDALGGCLAGRSYAVPDVSGGVSVTFEEVYPI